MRTDTWVNSLLAGCGKETEKLELQSILHQIVEAYHGREIDDGQLYDYATKLCDSIVVLASQCGKSLEHDRCVEELVAAVKTSVPRGALRSMLASMRRGRRSRTTAGETGILP